MVKLNNKILVIVESPNKIKKISGYLDDSYIVMASYGHVYDLAVNDPRAKLGVDPRKNYKTFYKILPEKKDKLRAIIDAAESAQKILIATDPDREGEAIAFHLADALESTGKEIKRISFNEITEKAVKKALKNERDLDKNLYDAQQARRVIDRLVGFIASEFLRSSFTENYSAGRVQSVATKLITERQSDIDIFQKEEFWNLYANFDKFSAKLNKRLTDQTSAETEKKTSEIETFVVSQIVDDIKEKEPNPPFITSTLQQAASKYLKFPVAKTMNLAQGLYESGLISYMRTDSTRIADEAMSDLEDYLKNNNYNFVKRISKKQKAAQDAHEAIRPTSVDTTPDKVFVDDDQQKLYKLIWERFVAHAMDSAKFSTRTIEIATQTNTFTANGKCLVSEGWFAIAPYYNHSNDVSLPDLKLGQTLKLASINIEQKFTQPPSQFTEETLVRELERRGIGRPSTYAEILSKIRGRAYVEVDDKTFKPTEVGKKVISKLNDYYSFMNFDYTAKAEKKFDKIAAGKAEYLKVLEELFSQFQKETKRAKVDGSTDYGIPCAKCGQRTVLKHGMYGYYLACIDYPDYCEATLSVDFDGENVTAKNSYKESIVDGIACPTCDSEMYEQAGEFGPFYRCTKYPKCQGKRKKPFGKKCPECGDELYLTLIYGHKKLSCMSYPKCKYNEDAPKDGWQNPKEIIAIHKSTRLVENLLKA